MLILEYLPACVHVCVSECVFVCAPVHTWKPEEDVRGLIYHFLPCSLETWSFTERGTRLVARKPSDPPVSTPHGNGAMFVCVRSHLAFYVSAGVLKPNSLPLLSKCSCLWSHLPAPCQFLYRMCTFTEGFLNQGPAKDVGNAAFSPGLTQCA